MFNHARKSTNGTALPSWLTTPGKIYMKHVRHSKYDPLAEEVELIEANPQYALIRHPDGREATVSLKHLAPSGNESLQQPLDNSEIVPAELKETEDSLSQPPFTENEHIELQDLPQGNLLDQSEEHSYGNEVQQPSDAETSQRHSTRIRRSPKYLQDYVEK